MDSKQKAEITQLRRDVSQTNELVKSACKVIDRLGLILKGNNKGFDKKLATLRKLIKNDGDLTELSEQLSEVNGALSEFEKRFTSSLRELKTHLLAAGESLQASKGMDDGIRRKLRMVMNKLKSTDSNQLAELQPNFLAFFDIVEAIKGNPANSDTNQLASSPTTQDAFNEQMMEKLITGLLQLARNDVIKPSLDTFSDRIRLADTNDLRIDICLSFFEEVVGRFSEEYSQTQKLILNINKALADVHNTLISSLKSSKGYDDQLRKLNKQIDKQINELSRSTTSATSLDQLQLVIDKKLSVINTSIKERDLIEQERSDKLQEALSNMESKLGGLEQRTEYYRKKWLEEKVRNGLDTLTGLPNRSAYDSRIQEEYQRWLRQPQPLCIAVMDIDHFKKINDTYGHSVGDKTLKIVASTLKKHLRATDFLARYGGEEFVAILLNSGPNEVAAPLEKVRLAVEKIPFKVKDKPLNITISIGYTQLLESDNIHTAFDRADKALYEAKDTGRNRVCLK